MTSEVKLQDKSRRNAAPKKKKIASLDKRKARAGWWFVLPFIIGFVCIYLPINQSRSIFFSKNVNRLEALTDMFYIAEAIIRKNTMTW